MKIFSPKLLGCLAALMALAVSASAQSSIQFSDLAGHDKAIKSEEIEAASGAKKLSVSDYNAPVSIFGSYSTPPPYDRLAMGPAYDTDNSANAKKWKQILDGRKNWALMTPEQILGVQTPEQILGIVNLKEKAGNNPDLSAEDRYLLRQSSFSSLNGGAAKAGARFSSLLPVDSRPSSFGQPEAQFDFSKGNETEAKDLNQALRMMANASPFSREPSRSYAGGSPFGLPAPVQKVTPDQLAGMERFRALLDSSAPVEKPAVSTVFSAPSTFSRPAAGFGGSAGSIFTPVALNNPAGRSFKPLTSELSKPVGITPLSGISRPATAPATKSATAPKPPPWLTDSTQPFKHF